MLLAHIFAYSLPSGQLTIAHFNHNLRPDSNQDEALVRDFAAKHSIRFVSKQANLADHSEATARRARHEFLTSVTKTTIATAHHLDDLCETIAINLSRGTGWRGLAVLNRPNYIRPLLELQKSEITSLAEEFKVQWREDSTNQSPKYLRNRLRPKIAALPFDTKWKLLKLQRRQAQIAQEINDLLQEYSSVLQGRNFYIFAKNEKSQIYEEALRFWLLQQNIRSTRPEIKRLLNAIQTYQPQKKFQLSSGRFILIRRHDFVILN
jgi:tRNA(Ile)-lysidine synthase